MSTAKTRAQDAARAARPMVSDCGASDQISANAAANGVAAGVLIWDEAGECYRIADAYSWSDVDALSDEAPSAFTAATAHRDTLQAAVDAASDAFKVFTAQRAGPLGLIPDAVKRSSEYRTACANFDRAYQTLRAFNHHYVRDFAAELRNARRARDMILSRAKVQS